jgi:hypothetical protein
LSFKRGVGVIVSPDQVVRDTRAGTFFNDIVSGVNLPSKGTAVAEGTNKHWARPTIANGRLYVRHGDALMAYDVKN